MKPLETIQKFDEFLHERNLSFEAIVIGGAALSILGIISRETQDDTHPGWPHHVQEQAKYLAERLGYGI